MALSERHRWCIKKITETFAPELDIDAVQLFIRQESNLQKLTQFLKGESSGRLFVFYQPAQQADGEVMDIICSV